MRKLSLNVILSAIVLMITCCNSGKETVLFEKTEYWGLWHAGDTTSVHYKMKVVKKGNDIIYYTTNFYPNGIEKIKRFILMID
jgi:hypothetical protein